MVGIFENLNECSSFYGLCPTDDKHNQIKHRTQKRNTHESLS